MLTKWELSAIFFFSSKMYPLRNLVNQKLAERVKVFLLAVQKQARCKFWCVPHSFSFAKTRNHFSISFQEGTETDRPRFERGCRSHPDICAESVLDVNSVGLVDSSSYNTNVQFGRYSKEVRTMNFIQHLNKDKYVDAACFREAQTTRALPILVFGGPSLQNNWLEEI